MKIKKTYQGAIPLNRIANEYNESSANAYSTNFINDNILLRKNLFHLQQTSLLNCSISCVSDNEFTMSVNEPDRGILYVTIKNLKQNTTYTFSYDVVNSNPQATPGIDGYWVTDSDEEIYNTELSGYPTVFTFNTEEYTAIRIRMYISYAPVTTTGTFSNIQLEEGDTRTAFSPTNMTDKGELFSYTERKIGAWVDGKPLYRRVISTYATIESEKEFKIAHGVSNWDKMWVDLGNSFFYENIRKRSLPVEQTFYTSASSTDMCHAFIEGDYVYIVSRGGWGEAWLKTITLNYTKNTD